MVGRGAIRGVQGLGGVDGLGVVHWLRRGVIGGRFGVVRLRGWGRGVVGGRMLRSRMVGSRCVVGLGGRMIGLVVGLTLVPDVGDVPVLVVGVVGDDLGPPVGEGDAVLSLHDSVLVLGLLLVEAGAGVVVVHAVLVGEGPGRDLVGVAVVGGKQTEMLNVENISRIHLILVALLLP